VWEGTFKDHQVSTPLTMGRDIKPYPAVCCLRGDIFLLHSMLYSGGTMSRGGFNTEDREEKKMQNSLKYLSHKNK